MRCENQNLGGGSGSGSGGGKMVNYSHTVVEIGTLG
jgi:hypothetical protein